MMLFAYAKATHTNCPRPDPAAKPSSFCGRARGFLKRPLNAAQTLVRYHLCRRRARGQRLGRRVGGKAVELRSLSCGIVASRNKSRTTLAKREICAIRLAAAGSNPAVDRLSTRRKQTSLQLTSTVAHNLRWPPEFFLFE